MSTDRSSIETTLRTMFKDGDRFMVGILRQNNGKEWMHHEFFSSIADAVGAVAQYDGEPNVVGIYITAQQLKPDATSNTKNDVEAYVRFVVDIDRKNKKAPLLDKDGQPVIDSKTLKPKMRPTNATDEERAECKAVAKEIVQWVSAKLDAKPMICDSGNGYHLVWFLDQTFMGAVGGVTPYKVKIEDTQRTVQECILAIKQRFEKGNVDVDVSVADPGQLIRLWGTWNRKAVQEQGRPWRQSKILSRPTGTVLPSALDVLACEYVAPKGGATKTYNQGAERTNPEWLQNYGIPDWCDFAGPYAPLIDTYEKNGETHYKIGNCVFDTEDGLHVHQDGGNERQTEIILHPDGSIGFSCLGSDDWFHENFPSEPKPTFSMLIKRVNQLKGENYPHLIFPERRGQGISVDDLESFGVSLDHPERVSKAETAQPEAAAAQPATAANSETQPTTSVQQAKVNDWTAAMFGTIFHDPVRAYPDFRIWRNRLDWIVRKKSLPKDELPPIALLLEYENAKKRLPTRDELTLYKPELIGTLSIPALQGNFTFDY
ncbi:MAG TPA: hypothetical protein VD837_14405 [Terriglobales bacterium]|nr:hypothetical protein [Terriglobales bacterium]